MQATVAGLIATKTIEGKNMIAQQTFETRCKDGVLLRGLLLLPKHPKAVLQFNGGTAAKKEFYLPFLNYLAAQGYLCCLWDYRGSGASSPRL